MSAVKISKKSEHLLLDRKRICGEGSANHSRARVDPSRGTSPSPSRALFFQARVNLELFKHMVEQLHALFDKLNYHNFARAFGTCHMNDGIFGELKHSAQMATEKERVLGFLLAMVTSGTASRTRSLVCASMIAAQTGGGCERIFRN